MAHFAEIDSDNIVIRVLSVPDEHEENGSDWCHDLYGGTWLQTSVHNNIRKNYAVVGGRYDPVRDEFIMLQPYASWTLDSKNNWKAPKRQPSGNFYWDETSLSWVAPPAE